MRLAFSVSLISAIAVVPVAKAASAPNENVARSVADLSVHACYGIASGAVPMPPVQDPNALEKSVKMVEGFGLKYGLNDSMMKGLGRPGLALISQSTMGSKSLEQGDVVLAVGGSRPGCRIILLSEPSMNVTEAVSAQLSRADWKAVPSMTATRGAIERRAFFRRDSSGAPYLMNLMTITTPAPDSKLRLFTTTIRIPAGVQLPEGL